MLGVLEKKEQFKWQYIWIVIVILAVLVGLTAMGLIAYGKSYDGKVLPGVHIGEVPVGGMSADELDDFLEGMNSKIANEGIPVSSEEDRLSFVLYPPVVPDSNIFELLLIDSEKEVERFISLNKEGGALEQGIRAVMSRIMQPSHELEYIEVNQEEIVSQIKERTAGVESKAVDARLSIDTTGPSTTFEVTSSSNGVAYDIDRLVAAITADWKQLIPPTGVLEKIITEPTIVESDIAMLEEAVAYVAQVDPIDIVYTDPVTKWQQEWTISNKMIVAWAEAQKIEDDVLVIGISRSEFDSFVSSTIASTVEVQPVDAKFEISDSQKVEAFKVSRTGVSIDNDALYKIVNTIVVQANTPPGGETDPEDTSSTVDLPVIEVQPNVSIGDVNDLGITEILGTGYSNFAGSPPNRVRNVRFAVEEKLNGYLIKPGEVFSLLDALRPFTIAGGYLPELVIKGDEIIPEVGGGLCQVGSTMFRAAMNSGLEIVERRNHSLVVSYYNDHRNGLPGTDATIYDSAPDFKFRNDTGNHVLLTTDMNEATGDLWFTLWGTGEGRKGYYTEPVVEQWIPAGPRRVTKTTDLAPGVWQCQGAHPGAVASFTYVIENEDGSKDERVFRSHYRPLPEICLVGATQEEIDAENAPEGEDGVETDEDAEQEDSSGDDGGEE